MIPPEPVFLDRDGVINENRSDYVRRVSQWKPFPGVFTAVSRLCAASHPVIVVTNQSGIGRGFFSGEDLFQIHSRMRALLEAEGGRFSGIYHCPHAPWDRCRCRKPETGMIEAARRDLVLSTGGWIAGDAATDIELGVRAGLKTVMVLTGRGVSQLEKIRNNNGPMPDFVVDDLAGAVELILSYSKV